MVFKLIVTYKLNVDFLYEFIDTKYDSKVLILLIFESLTSCDVDDNIEKYV